MEGKGHADEAERHHDAHLQRGRLPAGEHDERHRHGHTGRDLDPVGSSQPRNGPRAPASGTRRGALRRARVAQEQQGPDAPDLE